MKIKLFTIPNLLTLANLLCGSVAAVAALVWGELTLAFGLVVLAAVFDFFDGFVARLLHQSSPIGLQLLIFDGGGVDSLRTRCPACGSRR